MPPFGADDPGPRLRSTVVEGDGSEDVGFDNIEPDNTTQTEAKTAFLPTKRSFFGLGRLLQGSNTEPTIIEPEKKPIRCFECGHIHEVSVAATSTQCARCSLYISLSDQDIREQYSRNIRTRGDVVIHKKGSVIGCEIACHNLTVLGGISGSVDCSGNATFKNSGKVLGSMHCNHIVIDKKCELDFPQGIIAESADIYGVVRGDILCSGTIHIFKTGSVLGDATAKAIVMKDGGVLTGQMNIQHDVNISLPEKGAARHEQAQPQTEPQAEPQTEPQTELEDEAVAKAPKIEEPVAKQASKEKVLAEKKPAKEKESAQSEPASAKPVQAEPVQAKPVQAEPVQAEPVQAKPVQAEPVAEDSKPPKTTNDTLAPTEKAPDTKSLEPSDDKIQSDSAPEKKVAPPTNGEDEEPFVLEP